MSYDVAGLGNALMDALVVVEDDAFLKRLKLDRGTTHMVDHEGWERAYNDVRQLKVTFDSGGSCANTVATVGLLGGSAVFCGQVGDDQMGRMYGDALTKACGQHALLTTKSQSTGKCLSIISKSDAERTMVTDLGAAISLSDVAPFHGLLRSSKIGHFEGYMLLDPISREMVVSAMKLAHEHGGQVSLDVSDPHVVRSMTQELREIVRDHVDVVFLNAEEARALTDQAPEQAVHTVADGLGVETVVVKRGGQGSLVRQGADLYVVPARTVQAVDTTGAGDAYAGGFLFGLSQGWPADRCGALASAVAGLTVSQIGAVVKDRIALDQIRREVTP
ncbi:MAG: adenosine kinase [Deltaproteobacteria bacterium]|nr:MAG: adenosine kinase [Deltaproteobacteria bacterium]